VVGATGAQGGGLVRAILGDPAGGFVVRAVTRNVGSAKARELASLGAEVVTADVDDPASFKRAFAGAWGAFCGARDLAFSRSLHPGLQTFERWLAANAEQIPRG
jgi:uncharacterized protein YbjT (DUF2867 family)